MEIANIANVAAITVICYLAALGVKATKLDNKFIPIICGVLGGILGVVGMFVIPEYPAGDVLNAAAVGIVSGFAATGINQVYKQMTKKTASEGEGTEIAASEEEMTKEMEEELTNGKGEEEE